MNVSHADSNNGESSIVSEIIEKVGTNAGRACLKYIDKSKLQERVSMLKGNESDSTIIENLSSEMIIDAMSKLDEESEKDNSDPLQKLGACAMPNNTRVITPMDYSTDFADDQDFNLPKFERAYSLPRRKVPKQQKLLRKTPSFISPVHKKRKSECSNVTPPEVNDVMSDSSDSDESFIDNFINSYNKEKSSVVNPENMPSKFNFDSYTSCKSSSSIDDEWVRSHCKALYAIFPEHNKIELRRRCRNLNNNDIKFADLIKEISSGVENYDDYESEIQLAMLLSKEEAERVKEEPQIVFIGCGICFGDYELDQMLTCPANDAHMFCSECLRTYARVQVEETNYNIKCLVPECTSLYSTTVLYNVLEPRMFNIMMNKIQEKEIEAAGIENLESCPFCPFALEFDVKATISTEDPVMRCGNPECCIISCRLCKKQDHRPAKCEENDEQTKARTLIENEATSAMIRKCYKCGKAFVRNSGCNHMTCSCGAQMCYICKQPYNLCRRTGACGQTINDETLHQSEVRTRVSQVKATIDPNLLLYDPTTALL